jgi:predicted chitinase
MLTVDLLARISENPDPVAFKLARDVRYLVPQMRAGKINTKKRVAAFLANVIQETDRLKTLEEYGDEAYFRSFLGGQWRYHGRGYLMNTWYDAYELLSDELGVDLIDHLRVSGDELDPDKLEQPQLAAKAAVWFWTEGNVTGSSLNAFADAGNFEAVCSVINRGQVIPSGPINGWSTRVYYYRRAMQILPDNFTLDADAPEPDESEVTPVSTLKQDVEKAISFGMAMRGAPYGTGWRAGTWPALSPLYSRIGSHDPPSWYRARNVICTGLINVLRYEICELPALGRSHGDAWPGGMAALGRCYAFKPGTREYPPVENTPRGWLVFSPYLGSPLALQGHVGIALGNGFVLEARVPTLSSNRTEHEGSVALTRLGGRPYTRIIPPGGDNGWLRR